MANSSDLFIRTILKKSMSGTINAKGKFFERALSRALLSNYEAT